MAIFAKNIVNTSIQTCDIIAEWVFSQKQVIKQEVVILATKKTTEVVAAVEEKVTKKATKKALKASIVVQCLGREIEEKEIIASVKKAWTEETGKKVGDMETLTMYVKAEEAAVYYVVNGTDTGKVEF